MVRDTEQSDPALLAPRVEHWSDDGDESGDEDDERGLADRVPTFRLL